eukprot:COSAG01_NODE_60348_length_295_cov_0.826531_1_plen_29_part_10
MCGPPPLQPQVYELLPRTVGYGTAGRDQL